MCDFWGQNQHCWIFSKSVHMFLKLHLIRGNKKLEKAFVFKKNLYFAENGVNWAFWGQKCNNTRIFQNLPKDFFDVVWEYELCISKKLWSCPKNLAMNIFGDRISTIQLWSKELNYRKYYLSLVWLIRLQHPVLRCNCQAYQQNLIS